MNTDNAENCIAKPKNKKRRLYDIHAWLGFNLAFLMTLLLATGTIATLSHEIDWLIQDDMRVTPATIKVPWGTLEKNVKAAANPDDMLTIFTEGESDYFAYRATFLRADGTRYFVHINQWTGKVTGTTDFLTVQRFFRDLHRYFFMPSFIGLPITGSLAIVLLISLYSGLKTTGRLKKSALRFRTNQGARVVLSDLHKVSGIWATWFIILMVVTAIWYLVEFGSLVAKSSFEPARPGPSIERIQEFGDTLDIIPASEFIKNAKAAFPNWEPVQILYPTSVSQAITVLGNTNDILVRSRANRVFIDPEDGSIIKVQKSTDLSTAAYINETADPLHFGNLGKLTTKVIWFIFGIMLTGMSITGVLMTYKRLKSARLSTAQIKTFPILILVMVAGFIYVKKENHNPEPSQYLAKSNALFNGFTMIGTLKKGESSDTLKVNITHPHGFPIIESVYAIDTLGNSFKLNPKTFSSTTIFQKVLPNESSMDYDNLKLKVTFPSGVDHTFKLNKPPTAQEITEVL
ncbi:PepSY domain-containing protein [Pseudoalteromonas sp. MMG010]|uniref:PepSY-associated TM helix domain-containing protein n=1 Tax=Pseudoalteromonas sp. MMG010 TaxID=2822685 RepID=UPI001B39DE08|nr:PepSY-associated TM helix domain-containing protein [Pseudoalteromonas sp. MMG010]MBQ4833883.1 PepSY domain-containing protein [Pseudoalteromonas sp. MMG010]